MFPNEQQLRLMFATAGTEAIRLFQEHVDYFSKMRLLDLNPDYQTPEPALESLARAHNVALLSGGMVGEMAAQNDATRSVLSEVRKALESVLAENAGLREELKLSQDHLVQFQSETTPDDATTVRKAGRPRKG